MKSEATLPNLDSLSNPSFKDAKLQKEFSEKGYVILEQELTQSHLAVLTKFCLENLQQYASSQYISTIELKDIEHRIKTNNLYFDVIKDLVNDVFIDYEQYYGGFGVKFTRETTLLEAHQDTTMVPYTANRTALTLWTPLIDVDIENGCVHVFPKSHRYNRLPRASGCSFAYENYMEEVLRMMIPVPIKKGQVMVMDQSLIHFSGPNRSEYVRVAVMGMIKPKEDSLIYYNRLNNSCDKLEVFDVPNDFYTYHMLSTRPENCLVTKVIENNTKPYLWFEKSKLSPKRPKS